MFSSSASYSSSISKLINTFTSRNKFRSVFSSLSSNKLFFIEKNSSRKYSEITKNQNNDQVEDDSNQRVPKFKNVIEHLRHQSSIFSIGPAEKTDFGSILDQLAALSSKFANDFDHEIRRKILAEPRWLTQVQASKLIGCRNPLPIMSNGAFRYPNLISPNMLSRNFTLDYISAIILSIIDYRANLRRKSPEIARHMFGAFRYPGESIDRHILTSHTIDKSSFQIAISRQNNFFLIELHDEMPQNEMFSAIKNVLRFVLEYAGRSIPFGTLSALPRSDATFGYRFLNQSAIRSLQDAQFLVCLDQILDDEILENDDAECMKQILASSSENAGNRWFDKSLQLIVLLTADLDRIVASGVCFERSLVKPQSVADMMQHGIEFLTTFKPSEIQPKLISTQTETDDDQRLMIKLQKIDFIKPSESLEVITSAVNDFAVKKWANLHAQFRLQTIEFDDYGLSSIERFNCDPEAWIRVAAYFALFNAQDGDEIRYPGITAEMLDYFADPEASEESLRLAIESNLFDQYLRDNGLDAANILRVYDRLLAERIESSSSSSSIIGENLRAKNLFKSLRNHEISRRLDATPVIAARQMPLKNRKYSSSLSAIGGPARLGAFSIDYQFLPNNDAIRFTIGHLDRSRANIKDTDRPLPIFVDSLRQTLLRMKATINDCD